MAREAIELQRSPSDSLPRIHISEDRMNDHTIGMGLRVVTMAIPQYLLNRSYLYKSVATHTPYDAGLILISFIDDCIKRQ